MKGKKLSLLDHGEIVLVDYMGSDKAIVDSARISYGEGTQIRNNDKHLIRYLMRHQHSSPTECCVLTFAIKCPIFVARQWMRHRTFSYNEYSARYSVMKDEFYEKESFNKQSTDNMQGRQEEKIDQSVVQEGVELHGVCYDYYERLIEAGAARELARGYLPVNCYTKFFVTGNLHNFFHFCKLRSDAHSQYEIRVYSDAILHGFIKELYPNSYKAFCDYQMEGVNFSRAEMEVLKKCIDGGAIKQLTDESEELSKREKKEFINKMGL